MSSAAVLERPTVAPADFAAPPVPMGDLFPYPARRRLRTAGCAGDDRQIVRLLWDDGAESELHALALRDRCPCTACRHPTSLERTLDQLAYPLDLHPEELAVTAAGGLRVVWSDGGHVSEYAPGWLDARGRPENAAPAPRPGLWGAELARELPRFPFAAAMADDGALLAALEALRDVGLVYLCGAPTEEGVLERFGRRVGYLRETNFGRTFAVRAVVDAVSNAYTAIELPLHVDLPTREYQPGYQLLHCIANEAAGGESTYADGFALAAALKQRDPEAFAVLAATPVAFRYHDAGVDHAATRPVIVTGPDGATVEEIRFNPSVMLDPDAPARGARRFYAAYRALVALTRDPAFRVVVRMAPGDIACFDNRRVLHGRNAFLPSVGRRHLEGAYIEREDVLSRIRTLRRRHPDA